MLLKGQCYVVAEIAEGCKFDYGMLVVVGNVSRDERGKKGAGGLY